MRALNFFIHNAAESVTQIFHCGHLSFQTELRLANW